MALSFDKSAADLQFAQLDIGSNGTKQGELVASAALVLFLASNIRPLTTGPTFDLNALTEYKGLTLLIFSLSSREMQDFGFHCALYLMPTNVSIS